MQRAQTVAVPDADDGGVRQSCLQQVVERGFGFFVECRGRLIHEQPRRTLQQGAREGDALLFTTG